MDIKTPLKSALEVIVFSEEEGVRFGSGLFGSKAFAGMLISSSLENCIDENEISIGEALKDAGGHPDNIAEARLSPDKVKAFLEVHIEQSPELCMLEKPLGIVTTIAGPVFWSLKITGRAGHAGAEQMVYRKDALTGAAEIILEIEQIAKDCKTEYLVGTVGNVKVFPGAANVIPECVEMTLDVRGVNADKRENFLNTIRDRALRICQTRGLELEINQKHWVDPQPMAKNLISLLESTAKEAQIPISMVVSGAAHDAMNMAKIAPACMLFVRNQSGISHSPLEAVDYDDVNLALHLTAKVIEKLVLTD